MVFIEDPVPAGVYHRVVDGDLNFAPGEVFVNREAIEKLAFHVEYKLTVMLVPVISHCEVKSRGRCIRFAPQLIGNNTMQWQVVMPSAKSVNWESANERPETWVTEELAPRAVRFANPQIRVSYKLPETKIPSVGLARIARASGDS